MFDKNYILSIQVSGSHLTRGRLGTKLSNMHDAEGNVRYLSSDDVSKLTQEAVSDVVSSVVTEDGYVDSGDQLSVNDAIQQVLKKEEVASEAFTPKMWESTFWDPLMARPDKLAKYLNQIVKTDANDNKKFSLDHSARSFSMEASFGLKVMDYFGLNAAFDHENSNSHTVEKEKFLKSLKGTSNEINWTGEAFRVKPMKLYRINLSELKTKTNIASSNVQIRRGEQSHSIKVKVEDDSDANANMFHC